MRKLIFKKWTSMSSTKLSPCSQVKTSSRIRKITEESRKRAKRYFHPKWSRNHLLSLYIEWSRQIPRTQIWSHFSNLSTAFCTRSCSRSSWTSKMGTVFSWSRPCLTFSLEYISFQMSMVLWKSARHSCCHRWWKSHTHPDSKYNMSTFWPKLKKQRSTWFGNSPNPSKSSESKSLSAFAKAKIWWIAWCSTIWLDCWKCRSTEKSGR